MRLGAVYGLTGELSAFDIPSERGVRLFVKRANAAGGGLVFRGHQCAHDARR